ncbi:MAG: hypothetical protein M3R59_06005 [Verrucomicrobiota bacterium]|nr:hypothetical protein [Verrucomicrobiota bacterium]
MNTNARVLIALTLGTFLLTPIARSQDEGTDTDINKMMKEMQKLQETEAAKASKPVDPKEAKKKLAQMEADSKKEMAEMVAKEKEQKAKLDAALKKQVEAPEPTAFPDWMPATPQFKAAGTPAKKIVNEEVRLLVTGTSPIPPRDILAAWKEATKGKPLNNFFNDITSNGDVTQILFLSEREEPYRKMRLSAHRDVGGKVTEIELAEELPKPEIADEE